LAIAACCGHHGSRGCVDAMAALAGAAGAVTLSFSWVCALARDQAPAVALPAGYGGRHHDVRCTGKTAKLHCVGPEQRSRSAVTAVLHVVWIALASLLPLCAAAGAPSSNVDDGGFASDQAAQRAAPSAQSAPSAEDGPSGTKRVPHRTPLSGALTSTHSSASASTWFAIIIVFLVILLVVVTMLRGNWRAGSATMHASTDMATVGGSRGHASASVAGSGGAADSEPVFVPGPFAVPMQTAAVRVSVTPSVAGPFGGRQHNHGDVGAAPAFASGPYAARVHAPVDARGAHGAHGTRAHSDSESDSMRNQGGLYEWGVWDNSATTTATAPGPFAHRVRQPRHGGRGSAPRFVPGPYAPTASAAAAPGVATSPSFVRGPFTTTRAADSDDDGGSTQSESDTDSASSSDSEEDVCRASGGAPTRADGTPRAVTTQQQRVRRSAWAGLRGMLCCNRLAAEAVPNASQECQRVSGSTAGRNRCSAPATLRCTECDQFMCGACDVAAHGRSNCNGLERNNLFKHTRQTWRDGYYEARPPRTDADHVVLLPEKAPGLLLPCTSCCCDRLFRLATPTPDQAARLPRVRVQDIGAWYLWSVLACHVQRRTCNRTSHPHWSSANDWVIVHTRSCTHVLASTIHRTAPCPMLFHTPRRTIVLGREASVVVYPMRCTAGRQTVGLDD
jgi:hypothetical protein